MNGNLYQGELTCLRAADPQVLGAAWSRWGHNSEYIRLLDSDPPRLWSAATTKEWIEKEIEKDPPQEYLFSIHTLADDRLVGFVTLNGISWNHGDSWVGIGIGQPDDWGRGYGSDAMNLVLRYAFQELGLHRVSLTVFEYNPRAVRSYEKVGFRREGALRQHLNREGRRWDMILMGILRQEWELRNV